MKGYLTLKFGEEERAERIVNAQERYDWWCRSPIGRSAFIPKKVTDQDFLVYVTKGQLQTMRAALNHKGFQSPADLRNPFWYKRATRRQTLVRDFWDAVFQAQQLPVAVGVPLPFWRSLVEKVVQTTSEVERARLRTTLGRFMLPNDTMIIKEITDVLDTPALK